MALGDVFFPFYVCVGVCECVKERLLVNVVGNSILDGKQLKALGYNNCQSWATFDGTMGKDRRTNGV